MNLGEIADFLSAELVGDRNIEITHVADLQTASRGAIAFVEKTGIEVVTQADCLIVPLDFASLVPVPLLKTGNPRVSFSRVAAILHPRKKSIGGVHASAVVADTAVVGAGVLLGAFTSIGEGSAVGDRAQIYPGTHIGDNVTIGKNCVFYPNVFISDGCRLGDGVILHSGARIGTDGFGYARDTHEYVKFPQIGTVVIEDDVEIGANTCIDRGALGETRIGAGTKIDNLVQIAHNVQIGKRVVIAAQTGISGSTVIEDDCVIGGQVGMGDHARVQSGAVIGSQAGVLPGKIVRPGIWWGTPVQPLDEYKRQNAHVKGLARLKADVQLLKKELSGKKNDPE